MKVKELIGKLKEYPEDYEISFNYKDTDSHSSIYDDFIEGGEICKIDALEYVKCLEVYIR